MRLFVAVRLAEPVVDAALAVAGRIQKSLGPQIKARWAPAENMHVTVRFIGDVTDDGVARVLDALRPPLAIVPFDVVLGSCGVFPPSGPPRVVWIGLASGQASLQAMHLELNRRLAPLGYEPEPRQFAAHLTLARLKDVERGAGRALRETVAGVAPLVRECRVTGATVFQSHLSSKGSTYEALLDIPCIG